MEWTVPHKHPDARGNRRYFSIASSPTEGTLRLGVKFYPGGSSFKQALFSLDDQISIVAAQISGDFTLPRDKDRKLVFIAGGIGITPFRSMIKYLLDKNEKRSIIVFYSNKNADEIIYNDIFARARNELGIKFVYTLTDRDSVPPNWRGKLGRIDENMIRSEVQDYHDRTFYLSGPHLLVTSFEGVLKNMGIKKEKIKTDFFPGFV